MLYSVSHRAAMISAAGAAAATHRRSLCGSLGGSSLYQRKDIHTLLFVISPSLGKSYFQVSLLLYVHTAPDPTIGFFFLPPGCKKFGKNLLFRASWVWNKLHNSLNLSRNITTVNNINMANTCAQIHPFTHPEE